MNAGLTVALMGLACLGLGAAILRVLGLIDRSCHAERLTWSFAIGFGAFGWLMFFVGIFGGFTAEVLWPLLAVSAIGCIFLRGTRLSGENAPWLPVEITLVGTLALIIAFDFLEALSPPADADSMAYHFALPKIFAAAGEMQFVPRALDGAIPLLVQLTYIPALALGAERGLTLWTFLSGWGAIAFSYVLARRFVTRSWALSVALLLATAPVVVFAGGSGQVELRIALFAGLAAIALSDAICTRNVRFALLAGLAVGFFVASKYTGLLFALACGVVLVGWLAVMRGPWFRHGVVLTIAALLAGGQWYAWNWFHTGDPVFPLLFGLVDYRDPTIWDSAHQSALATYQAIGERDVPVSLWWLIAYPFAATLKGFPVFESTRTGLGPFVLMILPVAMLAAWRLRTRAMRSSLLPMVAVAALFYALWFGSGVSQRIRHLLPVYPLVLVALTVAAKRWSEDTWISAPLLSAAILAGGIQVAGHALFARNFAQHVLTGESRDAFLARNVWGYDAVQWINANLRDDDRVMVPFRNLIYLFEVPTFYAHPIQEARIDLRPDAADPARLVADLRRERITHVLAAMPQPDAVARGLAQWIALESQGCLKTVKAFDVETFPSRTLPTLGRAQSRWQLLELDDASCRSDGPHANN